MFIPAELTRGIAEHHSESDGYIGAADGDYEEDQERGLRTRKRRARRTDVQPLALVAVTLRVTNLRFFTGVQQPHNVRPGRVDPWSRRASLGE
jgi:hypothetical protein